MSNIDQLATKLQPHYTHFNVADRLLFTGHSHQAWPDAALKGMEKAYQAAAIHMGDKWHQAFQKTEILHNYLRSYYDDSNGWYCQGENTHSLLVSWLSSFDLRNKPKIITTDGEFYSMRRQLQRLQEEGIEIYFANSHPDSLVADVERNIDHKTAAVMLSRVFFSSGLVNQQLPSIAELARKHGVPLLIDDYHGTNVVPLSLREAGLEDCYLVTGGYKYLQWGEGNCFLRFPEDCALRPAITGWFATFNTLEEARADEGAIGYNNDNQRFATGTYDPTSQFRAAEVVLFFKEQGLTPSVLRQQYLSQIQLLKAQFQAQDLDPDVVSLRHYRPLEENGGFLAIRSHFARSICKQLKQKRVYTDARGNILRLGPAPYTTTDQIHEAMDRLAQVVQTINSPRGIL